MLDIKNFESSDAYDKYILVLVMLPKDDGIDRANLKSQKCNPDGNILGSRRSNPFLDNRVYEVEFQDSTTNEHVANLNEESLYLQTNPKGNKFMLLKDTNNHRSTDKAVPLSDSYKGSTKIQKRKKTTTSWELMVEWADKIQPQTWISLKSLK